MYHRKLISWCLYVDPENLRRLPEYLVGLRCNQRAARRWFPGWKLRLYVNSSLNDQPEVAEFVRDVSQYGTPEIELVQCREGKNPMVERFRALLEPDVDVCLVRDVDSILSKSDADRINAWLADDESDVFRYREYQMDCKWSMGGGMAGKNRAFVGHFSPNEAPSTDKLGRGEDEPVLANMLKHIPQSRQTEQVTRMLENGVYLFYSGDPRTPPSKSEVLWPVPFFDCLNGYADNHPDQCWLRNATQQGIVKWCETTRIRREHTGGHYEHHRTTLIDNSEWVR